MFTLVKITYRLFPCPHKIGAVPCVDPLEQVTRTECLRVVADTDHEVNLIGHPQATALPKYRTERPFIHLLFR